ncbi:MAG TPA: NADH-quinone oxidoreductase subunit J [Bacteroidota bacterium]|nr:NADH-quinone oxidoreductase subunit J [Bacteroidota bacterium]
MTFALAVFCLLAAVSVVSAVLMIIQRNPVNSALYLILNFFSLAALYLTLHAQFIAIVQIFVYAGAIMVLFLFVIMLLNLGDDKRLREHLGPKTYLAVALAIGLVLEFGYIFSKSRAEDVTTQASNAAQIGTVEFLGQVLFTKFLFPFEMTSFLLLAAIVGAVVLAKKKLQH